MFYNENSIINGLIYHFDNYSILHSSMSPINAGTYTKIKRNQNWLKIIAMRHELAAYLNRMGQFYYFAKSARVNKYNISLEIEIPTILKFMPLRHKVTSHRAIDQPKRNDITEHVQASDNQLHGGAYVLFDGIYVLQLKLENNTLLHFDLLQEHSKILAESNKLLSLLEEKTK